MISTKWMNGTDDISEAIKIRLDVFCTEQGCPPYIELDALDPYALHLVVYDSGAPVATGRIVVKVSLEGARFYLGRIAVLKEHRGKKLGDFVVRLLIRKAYSLGGYKQYLHAQVQAKGFYERLGFREYGEPFMEDMLPHVCMEREGDIGGEC